MQSEMLVDEIIPNKGVPASQIIYAFLGVPSALWDLFEFAGVLIRNKKDLWPSSNMKPRVDLSEWVLVMPVKIPSHRVEIPLPAEIDKVDPEGHWRAILAAAADFQYLVNSGQYHPG